MNKVEQNYLIKAIEETIQKRVEKTIQAYADQNSGAFKANKIAGIEASDLPPAKNA